MTDEPHRTIKIWQQNTRKSLDAQLLTIHAARNNYDILCIQEPHFDHLNVTRATPVWRLVTPTGWNRSDPVEKTPRSIILVHERIPTNSWMQINIDSLLELDYVICHMVSRLTNLVMSWSQGGPGMQGMALYVSDTISVFGLAVT